MHAPTTRVLSQHRRGCERCGGAPDASAHFHLGTLRVAAAAPRRVILGSLNEGTGPQTSDPGPWLNRPDAAALGCRRRRSARRRRSHLYGAAWRIQVYLTRRRQDRRRATVPSRWFLRLQALLTGTDTPGTDQPWLAWRGPAQRAGGPGAAGARARAAAAHWCSVRAKLSATTIEKWIANP